MGTYTPDRILISSGLDQAGTMKSLPRLEGETMGEYRKRLMLEARDPSGASEKQFVRSVGRGVNELDVPVYEISLTNDPADPYIEVNSFILRAYSDYENDTLDFEVDFTNRSDGYFLRDVKSDFDASSFFSLEVLDTDHTYKRSDRLRVSESLDVVFGEPLRQSHSNKLQQDNIKSFHAQAAELFQEEVGSASAVSDAGEFYIDKDNGVVFTADPAFGLCSYVYRTFPFRLYWQKVRTYPLSDPDNKIAFKDDLIADDTGEAEPAQLNSYGARLYNEVLMVNSLGWGE